MTVALGVAAVLGVLPKIARLMPPPGAQMRSSARSVAGDRNQLTKVRALLAKAESTEFPDEAEALSAKAQEIISRYALDHLLNEPQEARPDGADDARARRLWIDASYVLPKALLLDAVALANRCSAVVIEQLGFTTVIGAPYDLEAVELLSTSLLVQANRAMLGHGSQVHWSGTSRATAFRRSFLIAYATRIGERLSTATDHAASETGVPANSSPCSVNTPSGWRRLRPSCYQRPCHGRRTSRTPAVGPSVGRLPTWRGSTCGRQSPSVLADRPGRTDEIGRVRRSALSNRRPRSTRDGSTAVRDIVVSMWITLDGFVTGPDDAMDWLLIDDDAMAYEQAFVDDADTLLLGRKTFNDFAGYWPGAARAGDDDDDSLSATEAKERAYARRVDSIDKVAVSASGNVADWGSPEVLSTIDKPTIDRLKDQPGKRIVTYGSLSVVGELSRLGMIDEYHLLVHPIFLGRGTPLFDPANPVKLQLKSAEPFGSGVVLMTYGPEEQS